MVYQRNALDELSLESGSFGGGRFSVSESGSGRVYTPNYYLTDHLGSTRAIVNALGTVVERSDYFPFGLAWANAQASTNRYLYNGKELQVAGFPDGSNYLDYGARIYLPRLGRFTASDPLSESFYGHTSYNFTLNNPVNLIDLYGLAPIRVPGGSFDFDTLLGSIDAVSCYGGSGGLSTFDRFMWNSTFSGNGLTGVNNTDPSMDGMNHIVKVTYGQSHLPQFKLGLRFQGYII